VGAPGFLLGFRVFLACFCFFLLKVGVERFISCMVVVFPPLKWLWILSLYVTLKCPSFQGHFYVLLAYPLWPMYGFYKWQRFKWRWAISSSILQLCYSCCVSLSSLMKLSILMISCLFFLFLLSLLWNCTCICCKSCLYFLAHRLCLYSLFFCRWIIKAKLGPLCFQCVNSLEDKLLRSCVLFSTCCVCNFLLVSLNNQSQVGILCLFQCVNSTKETIINHLLTHFQMTQLLHNVAIQEK
jgi:hypothetical protein